MNVQLRCTAGDVNERGMYWVVRRRYKSRPNNSTEGTFIRDYYLGASYYRDANEAIGDISP